VYVHDHTREASHPRTGCGTSDWSIGGPLFAIAGLFGPLWPTESQRAHKAGPMGLPYRLCELWFQNIAALSKITYVSSVRHSASRSARVGALGLDQGLEEVSTRILLSLG
jgi:hypothetical protein